MLRLLAILLCIGLPLGHAAPEPTDKPDFLVRIWRSEEGLPGNVVRSISQGPDGFLWVATAEGLARFDGRTFEPITPGKSIESTPEDLFRVFTPSDGSIWVSGFKGGLYRVAEGVLETIPIPVDQIGRGLITLIFIHDGAPHFHYNDAIWRLESNGEILPVQDSEKVAKLLKETLANEAKRDRRLEHTIPPEQLIDRNGGQWVVMEESLSYRPADSPATASPIPDFDGELVVSDMLEDREGNIWLASPVKGLIRIRHRRVNYLQADGEYYEHAVTTSLHTADGNCWIASRTGGIDRIRNGIAAHVRVDARGGARPVSCLFEDSSGRLWAGTRDASVYLIDRESLTSEAQFGRTPELSKISAITEDADGGLWFGGQFGLSRLKDGNLEKFTNHPLLIGADIECLAHGSDGSILAGTADGRVFRHQRDSGFEILRQIDDVGTSRISSILPSGDNKLWATTLGSGLLLFDDNRWHQFDNTDGLPENRLTSIAESDGGILWIGSLKGIIRISASDLLKHAADPSFAPRWTALDRSDGMITRECTGGGQPGVTRDPEGTLWFPSTAGLAGVNPADVVINPIPPSIHFQPCKIDGIPVANPNGFLKAGPGRVRIEFRFGGVSLSAPEKVTYRIQLDGIDNNPQRIDTETDADYLAVPPGKYLFKVWATNGDGISTPTPATLPLEVLPQFWQTPWFLALTIIGGALAVLAAGGLLAKRRLRQRMREIRMQGMLEAERSRISRDLHDDLGASLTELSIISAIAAEENRDQRLHGTLDQLTTKSQRVVGTLDEIVWATNPSQDSLHSLVEYITYLADDFLSNVDLRFHAELPQHLPDVKIGPRRRHHVLLATREAINNAVKHSEAESILLAISAVGGKLTVRVEDDGRGFDPDQSTSGNGLANLRQRMSECGGECRIDSRPGEGTTVTLVLPLPD